METPPGTGRPASDATADELDRLRADSERLRHTREYVERELASAQAEEDKHGEEYVVYTLILRDVLSHMSNGVGE